MYILVNVLKEKKNLFTLLSLFPILVKLLQMCGIINHFHSVKSTKHLVSPENEFCRSPGGADWRLLNSPGVFIAAAAVHELLIMLIQTGVVLMFVNLFLEFKRCTTQMWSLKVLLEQLAYLHPYSLSV